VHPLDQRGNETATSQKAVEGNVTVRTRPRRTSRTSTASAAAAAVLASGAPPMSFKRGFLDKPVDVEPMKSGGIMDRKSKIHNVDGIPTIFVGEDMQARAFEEGQEMTMRLDDNHFASDMAGDKDEGEDDGGEDGNDDEFHLSQEGDEEDEDEEDFSRGVVLEREPAKKAKRAKKESGASAGQGGNVVITAEMERKLASEQSRSSKTYRYCQYPRGCTRFPCYGLFADRLVSRVQGPGLRI
jgi:hypothetical protein